MEKRTQRYIVLTALTLDGRIAEHSMQFTGWTSPEDKVHMQEVLGKCEVVIAGNNTYKTAYTPMSKRNSVVFTRSVESVKVESELCTYINVENADLQELMEERGYETIGVVGGNSVYNYLAEQGLIDEIYITIEPIVFGNGLPFFDTQLPEWLEFSLQSSKQLNERGSMLLHYTVNERL